MNKVRVIVRGRSEKIWEGEGTSCSMENEVGIFDVLPQHTQMVTPIKGKIVVREANSVVWEYTLSGSALCRVKGDMVEVWVGVGE